MTNTAVEIYGFKMKRKLLIDHDAGVDDLAAVALIILSNQFEIKGISITPADSYPESALETTLGLLKFLNRTDIPVVLGTNEGKNHFPKIWRDDSLKLSQIHELKIARNEFEKYGYRPTSAPKFLAQILENESCEILVTGPLSNISEALTLKPNIASHIKCITFMGGALRIEGNVEMKDKPVAEWNVFNNPESLNHILEMGIRVKLVSLDSTNATPVSSRFMQKLKTQITPVSQLFYKIWSVIAPQIENPKYQKTYFFWDTLTAAILIDPNLAAFREQKIQVILEGNNEGQTRISENGFRVSYLSEPNPLVVEDLILKIFT